MIADLTSDGFGMFAGPSDRLGVFAVPSGSTALSQEHTSGSTARQPASQPVSIIHLAGSVRVITIPIRAVLVQVVSVLKQFSRIKQGEPFSSALAAQGLAREVFSSALAVGETMAAISSAERFLC